MPSPALFSRLPPLRARFWKSRGLRPAAQLVDLDRVLANARAMRVRAGAGPFFAVIKANAYSLGAVPVARALSGETDGFGVATLEEGLELRRAGISAPVLLLSGCFPHQLAAVYEANLLLGVVSLELLQAAAAFASVFATAENPLVIHPKFDTGMGRLGLTPDQAVAARDILRAAKTLRLEGLYSHFAAAESADDPLTGKQTAAFAELCALFAEFPAARHLANSAGLRTGAAPGAGGRTGIALVTGLHDTAAECATSLAVYPLLSKWLPAGHAVGYGPDLVLRHETRIAVLPVGYADGVPRAIAGQAWLLAAGERVPVLGRVSMDLTTVRWPDHAAADAPVWLMGGDGPSLHDWARWGRTIPYEILTGFDGRLTKIYFKNGRPVEIFTPRHGYDSLSTNEWEITDDTP